MKKQTSIVIFILLMTGATLSVSASPGNALAQLAAPQGILVDPARTILVFYSSTCPHCHNLMQWMSEIEDRFPDLEIHNLEVVNSGDQARRDYFQQVMSLYETEPRGVPRTVIGDKVFVGFSPDSLEDRFVPEYGAWIGTRVAIMRAMQALQEEL